MVELQLEALDFGAGGKETYVAVRVGEVQKFSRLASTRNYKFPAAVVADRKFGKVDIFHRVGTANIGIKNSSVDESTQEVSIELKDASSVGFRVRVGGKPEVEEKRRTEAQKLKSTETNQKLLEAKTYLLEHNLEERLAEAMQGVLRERPEDPAEFIAQLMRKSASDYKRLEPTADVASVAPDGESREDKMKKRAKQALLSATEAGALSIPKEAAAAGVNLPKAATKGEALRLEAKEALLKATLDGRLENTMQEALGLVATTKSAGIVQGLAQAAAAAKSPIVAAGFALSAASVASSMPPGPSATNPKIATGFAAAAMAAAKAGSATAAGLTEATLAASLDIAQVCSSRDAASKMAC